MAIFEESQKMLDVMSDALAGEKQIPTEFTKDGNNESPPIHWTSQPDAKCYAVVVDDPDAQRPDPFVHWVVWNIPATATQLPRAVPQQRNVNNPAGALQGRNDFGDIGYDGPAPPKKSGTHHYRFRVLALNAPVNLPAGATVAQLYTAIEGKVTAWGEAIGTYKRG